MLYDPCAFRIAEARKEWARRMDHEAKLPETMIEVRETKRKVMDLTGKNIRLKDRIDTLELELAKTVGAQQ